MLIAKSDKANPLHKHYTIMLIHYSQFYADFLNGWVNDRLPLCLADEAGKLTHKQAELVSAWVSGIRLELLLLLRALNTPSRPHSITTHSHILQLPVILLPVYMLSARHSFLFFSPFTCFLRILLPLNFTQRVCVALCFAWLDECTFDFRFVDLSSRWVVNASIHMPHIRRTRRSKRRSKSNNNVRKRKHICLNFARTLRWVFINSM